MSTQPPTPDACASDPTSIINRIVAFALEQRLLIILLSVALLGAGLVVAAAPADGCLSRSFAADGGDRHAVAGAFRRGSGAPDHGAGRARHERRAEASSTNARSRCTACPTSRSPSATAPTTISRASRCSTASAIGPAGRRGAVGLAAVLALGPDLSLRAAEHRPLADGTEDLRGLGHRAAVPLGPRRGRRFRLRRRRHAVPGAARSGQARRGSACRCRRSRTRWRPTTAMPAAASIRRAASSTTCAAWGGSRRSRTSATSCWRCTTARRCWSRTSATSQIGIAPRLGEFGYMGQDDAVEGVILMRTGEKTQDVLKRGRSQDRGAQRRRAAEGRQDPSVLRPAAT